MADINKQRKMRAILKEAVTEYKKALKREARRVKRTEAMYPDLDKLEATQRRIIDTQMDKLKQLDLDLSYNQLSEIEQGLITALEEIDKEIFAVYNRYGIQAGYDFRSERLIKYFYPVQTKA